jgi:hypothetical protein
MVALGGGGWLQGVDATVSSSYPYTKYRGQKLTAVGWTIGVKNPNGTNTNAHVYAICAPLPKPQATDALAEPGRLTHTCSTMQSHAVTVIERLEAHVRRRDRLGGLIHEHDPRSVRRGPRAGEARRRVTSRRCAQPLRVVVRRECQSAGAAAEVDRPSGRVKRPERAPVDFDAIDPLRCRAA